VRRLSTETRDPLPVRDPAAFRAALDGIDADPDARESSVVATPGLAWDATGRPILEIIAGHCTRSRRRIALIDLPADAGGIAGGGQAIGALGLPSTSFAAAYHPWLVVANPLGDPPTVLVPPSGFMAGLFARIDLEHGVWKVPGGRAADLAGAVDVGVALDQRAIAALTGANVNAIRRFGGGGPVAWGARTLAPPGELEWKYVNVRRLAIFLERSIDEGTQWAVFEPNDEPLWGELRRVVDGFLTAVWRQGGLVGTRPQEAWFVQCGLGSTMTQADIDNGRAIVDVGIAPLRPAEFVILRFALATAGAAA
jgi:phage tail sheath protein FI